MNKYIRSIIKNMFPKELPKPIGRWSILHSNKQINNKIDLSNEDHCGPCGQYALSKIEYKNKKISKNKKKDIYIKKTK